MHIISSILLAISSNIDNLGVGIVFGLRKMRIPLAANLLIALITGLGTFIAMKAGEYVLSIIPPFWANLIGSGIMVLAGCWVMLQSWAKPNEFPAQRQETEQDSLHQEHSVKNESRALVSWHIKSLGLLIHILKEPTVVDQDYSDTVDLKEAILLGLALSLNNLAGGIGGGMAGLDSRLTALLATLISIIFIFTGTKMGHNLFSKWIGAKAAQIAGLMLIAIGIFEFFV